MSDLAASPVQGFRLNGWHVLAMIVGFFAVVIAIDVSFAVLAYRTHPGEVSVTPYEDGLIYNRKLAQLSAQAELGWQAAAAAEPDKVVVVVVDSAQRPITGLKITGKMERPATETGRLTPRFVETSPGRYEAALKGATGAWDLTAATHGGATQSFEFERRLTWP